MDATKCRVLSFPIKPGMQQKRIRRKKCPDQLLPLPSPPKLYEADPQMLADVEKAAKQFFKVVRKYHDRMPPFWYRTMADFLSASGFMRAVKIENECLLEEARKTEQKIKAGMNLVISR